MSQSPPLPPFPLQIPPVIGCPACHQGAEINSALFTDHFYDRALCRTCGARIDVWTEVLTMVRGQKSPWHVLVPIGAHMTVFTVTLNADQVTEVVFADHGIPTDAKILKLNYTPQGGSVFPAEMQGNEPVRYFTPPVIRLYGSRSGPPPHGSITLVILATWVPSAPVDDPRVNLVNAFEAYEHARLQDAIVPANVVVESTLSRLLTTFLERVVSRSRVDGFLTDAATYGDQLNVVLPTLLHFTEAPALSDEVRGNLNRLRNLRNQIAHRGVPDDPLTREDIARCLCAAVFGVHYLTMIEPILLR